MCLVVVRERGVVKETGWIDIPQPTMVRVKPLLSVPLMECIGFMKYFSRIILYGGFLHSRQCESQKFDISLSCNKESTNIIPCKLSK